VGTFEHTHIHAHTHNPWVETVWVTCHHPSCNSSCISGDLQLQAPSSTGADDNNNITSSLSSGLDRARASHHCCPLAPAFCPVSSRSQWQGWVLGPLSSSSLFLLLSPCPHSCCPLICPVLTIAGGIPHIVCSIVLLSVVLFHSSLAFHGLFPLAVLIRPIAPCFHPMSSCSQQWLGVLWWWWLLLWLVGCCLIVV
jgi:hypothetical protein